MSAKYQITLKQLATILGEADTQKECPFCNKDEWGAEKHEEHCPFALAYRAFDQEEVREANSRGGKK